ncbi:lysoplasmalogenase [Tamlana agarivorans]|uniref:Lysoplasmalogenase n=1 Tax=Pseudotamlana agarivorans TaxID=481183 RepID=A0ACC5U776_9FLAO|nr:lysoplasmalogenase family protein [Tamlana agarivorans]MBU2950065.1 lysoplasmalogenase [Tamlana agarivorans]
MPKLNGVLKFLKDKRKFAVLFFVFLIIDTVVKSNYPWPYRFVSKPPVILLIVFYYYYNYSASKTRNFTWVMLALACFFIADLLIINRENTTLLISSFVVYTLAKVFLCFRFSHKFDFKVSRLIPFSIVIFIYTVGLIVYIYEGLGNYFLFALISYFISLLLCQFAYLRKEAVDKKSYLYVLIGVLCYMVSEGFTIVNTFKTDLPYQDFCIMFFYATGIYLIVHGIIIEKRITPKYIL